MALSIVAFIPCRSGSKGIPDKNIKELGGKPLMVWSIESAFAAGIQNVIVNTDSKKYAKIARQAGAKAVYITPIVARLRGIHQDNSSMYKVLKSEIPRIKPIPDVVLLLQATSPFRKKVHIKNAISFFTSNMDKYDSLISVEKVPEKYNPYAMIMGEEKRVLFRKLVDWKERIGSWFGKKYKKYKGPNLLGYPVSERMLRRQDLPQTWLPTGEIYLFKTENLKNGSIYGDNVMLYECEGSPNLNTLEDWEQAEQLLKEKE